MAQWGWDVFTHTKIVPKPAPVRIHWTIGPVSSKLVVPPASHEPGQPPQKGSITVQLTADQQVALSISGEDAYGNPVEIDAPNALWTSSDEAIITLTSATGETTIAVAVGPVGTAAVTVSNVDSTVQGSLAIDVVAGEVTEIVVNAGTPTDKA